MATEYTSIEKTCTYETKFEGDVTVIWKKTTVHSRTPWSLDIDTGKWIGESYTEAELIGATFGGCSVCLVGADECSRVVLREFDEFDKEGTAKKLMVEFFETWDFSRL